MSQVSQISLSSNINQYQNKQSSSSKFDQSTEGGQTSRGTFDCNSSLSRKSALTNQIHKIQQAQSEMEKKFEKCIESLIKQIEQKQALTNRLVKEISDLKENIQQSKKDIQTISSYVRKNVRNTGPGESKLTAKTSQKNIEGLGSYRSLTKVGEEQSIGKGSTKLLGSK